MPAPPLLRGVYDASQHTFGPEDDGYALPDGPPPFEFVTELISEVDVFNEPPGAAAN